MRSVFSPISTSDKTVLRTIVDEETWVGHGYVAFWDAVSVGVRTIRQEPQRRVLLVFGSGLDTARLGPGSAPELVIEAALQSDVMIYGISLERRGLDASLRRAARETGGGGIEISPSADPSRAMADVVAELHSQYAIGVASLADGRQHRITVATRTNGITLRARSSYVAAK